MRVLIGIPCAALLLAVLATAEETAPKLQCATKGNFTNCNVVGKGTFEDVLAAVQKMSERPPSEDAAVIAELTREKNTLPPPFLYELSRRLLATKPQEALYYFNLSGLRARYDGMRCKDKTALQGYQVVILTLREHVRPVSEFGLANPETMLAAGKDLKARDEIFTGKASPWWICSHGMQAFGVAIDGRAPTDWLISEAEWPTVQKQLRDMVDGAIKIGIPSRN